jgi:hypothetical protein
VEAREEKGEAMARPQQFRDQIKKRLTLVQERAASVKDAIEIDVPEQLRGAWDRVVGQIRTALDFATREDLAKLAKRVDALAAKIDGKAPAKKKTKR